MRRITYVFCLLVATLLALAPELTAQDPKPGQPGHPDASLSTKNHSGSSPFHHPEPNDTTFVADTGAGLDTGCTFRSGGPLEFSIEVDRVVGDVDTLRSNGLISEQATLRMPAFDVDFDANVSGFNPERDRVFFNGKVVPGEFLTGSNNVWKLNTFSVPIEWVRFASDPGAGGTAQPEDNFVRIEIDTANSDEVWCTAIDWAVLEFEAVRPVVMAHGILSNGGIWNNVWVPRLNDLGILTDNDLDMGALDSIQSNAGKIAAVVERDKKRWGVDRVNLVSHSKGGLDSRHFAENDDSIDQIVQLGTPNAGSPLADVAQAGAVVLTGLGGTAIINALAGPAGIQLTTPYMAIYNATHGSNPKVQYTAMAGDYDPDCSLLNPFCRPIERLLLSITGPGDTIVPITSVHALGYTIDRTFQSSGTNKEATHSGLHGSTAVFNATSDRVRRFGRAKAALTGDALVRTATVGGSIEPAQQAVHTIPVEESTPAFVSMFYAGGEAELVLISPSGQRIDPAAAAADSDASFEAGGILGGSLAVYNLAQIEVGIWTAEVTGVSVTDPLVPVGYAVHVWLENPAVRFAGEADPSAVSAGEPIELFATLLEAGAPLTGANASARVGLPDGTATDVTLLDDGSGADVTAGDGIYSGRVVDTSQPGFYRIAFTAGGTDGAGAAFSREDFALATASVSSSSFTGTFRDFGRDTNGNGLYDELVVEVDVDVTAETDYRLFGVLTDAAGNSYEASFDGRLVPGPTAVELAFDGERIFDNRVDGPYTLSVVRLVEEGDLTLLPVDELLDAHQTAGYSFEEFEHSPIRLTGNGSAQGIDLDGNGLYDLLDVRLEVEVDVTAFYQWSGLLTDAGGTEIGFDTGGASLSAGANDLRFVFDGSAIGRNGVDGPYFLSSLLVLGGGSSLVVGTAFETPAFTADQFEGFSVDTIPPEIDVTLKPNVLWPVDHRLVEVTATVSVTDNVDPDPAVELLSIVSNEDDDGLGDGHTTDDVQGAAFGSDDRSFLLRAERSGLGDGRIYTVTYRARDAAGNTATASATVVVPHDRSGKK